MWISPTGTGGGGGGGGGGGFVAADLVALSQATNLDMNDDSLAYIVTDPGGTATSKKSTLSRAGMLPESWVDQTYAVVGGTAVQAGSVTAGIVFGARRAGQICTGVRLYWGGGVGPKTLTISLWEYSSLFGANSQVATGTVSVDAQGFVSAAFLTPYTLLQNKLYAVSWWNATHWPVYSNAYFPGRDKIVMRDYLLYDGGCYKSGGGADAAPDVTLGVGTGSIYEIEPVLLG